MTYRVNDRFPQALIKQVQHIVFVLQTKGVPSVVHQIKIRQWRNFPAITQLGSQTADVEIVVVLLTGRCKQIAVALGYGEEALVSRAHTCPLHVPAQLMARRDEPIHVQRWLPFVRIKNTKVAAALMHYPATAISIAQIKRNTDLI